MKLFSLVARLIVEATKGYFTTSENPPLLQPFCKIPPILAIILTYPVAFLSTAVLLLTKGSSQRHPLVLLDWYVWNVLHCGLMEIKSKSP